MSRSLMQSGTLNTAPESASLGPSATYREAQTGVDGLALRRFRAALADADANPCNILFLGHSITEGYTAVNMASRFADSTVTALRRKRGITGGLGHKKANYQATLAGYPISVTNLTGASGFGMGGTGAAWVGASWGPITVNIPTGTTSVDIVWTRGSNSTGTCSYSVDGGAATNISGAGANSGYQVTNVAVSSGTSHTMTINYVSGQIAISGVTFYAGDETSGIRSWEAGAPGATSTGIASHYITGSGNLWRDMITATSPALVVITAMVNDYSSGATGTNPVPSATTRANFKGIVDGIKSVVTTAPSVVICVEHQRNSADNLMKEPWVNYVNAAYSVAKQEGYALFDWRLRLGNTDPLSSVNAGILNSDRVHPTSMGHKMWGESLATFLANQ